MWTMQGDRGYIGDIGKKKESINFSRFTNSQLYANVFIMEKNMETTK